MTRVLLACLVAALAPHSATGISCRDQHNFEVPWFAAYKMPRDVKGDTIGSEEGTGFYYLDALDRTSFKPSVVPITEQHQAVGYTLDLYYSNRSNPELLHVFYNDEPVNVTNASLPETKEEIEWGHTKGFLIFDSSSGTGIWMIHSVPKFPHPLFYEYPPTGKMYGQTFLCLTLDAKTLAQLGTALFYNHPWVYSYTLPDWARQIAPDLVKVLDGQFNMDASSPTFHQPLSLAGVSNGPTFEVFAKSHVLYKDVWESLIAPVVGSIEVETWRRGHLIDINCTSNNVIYDAQTLKIGKTDEFKYTKDHSKYARTIAQNGGKVCIGDMNRMTTQFKRGGGAVCIQDPDLWNAYSVFRQLPDCPQ